MSTDGDRTSQTRSEAACGLKAGCGVDGGLFPPAVSIQEVRVGNAYEWKVVDTQVTWRGTFGDSEVRIVVPPCFTTDLASVPRFMTWLVPRYGLYTRAAIVHDFLCRRQRLLERPDHGGVADTANELGDQTCSFCLPANNVARIELEDRSDADEIFRLLLRTVGGARMPWPRVMLMYSAVTWATIASAIVEYPRLSRRHHLAHRAAWLRLVLLAVIVMAGVALSVTGIVLALTSGFPAAVRWPAAIAAATGLLGESLALAGVVALGRPDRFLSFTAVVSWTVLSLPLLATGLLAGFVLLLYLTVEQTFCGFRGTRHWLTARGQGASADRKKVMQLDLKKMLDDNSRADTSQPRTGV